jgi:hypothetical protein
VSRPTALVLAAAGTNRDRDVAFALDLAGAEPRLTLLAELIDDATILDKVQMVIVAGGFSYADALGAGRMFALQLEHRIGDALQAFVAAARPVIGICNGFQVPHRAAAGRARPQLEWPLPVRVGAPAGTTESLHLDHRHRHHRLPHRSRRRPLHASRSTIVGRCRASRADLPRK